MRELMEVVARMLVSDPGQVKVTETIEGDNVIITLSVAREDTGRIIGKQGRIIQAIRVVLNAVGTRNGQRVDLRLHD